VVHRTHGIDGHIPGRSCCGLEHRACSGADAPHRVEVMPHAARAIRILISCVVIFGSLGFLIASVVPTARFAQPVGTLILYPMVGLSGLFVPISSLPPTLQLVARLLPLTYTVSLLRGIWRGDGWIAHTGDVAALGLIFLICTAVSSRLFRWQ